MYKRSLIVLCSALVFAGVSGCGGGGAAVTTNPYFDVEWPERNRSLTTSQNAESVAVGFYDEKVVNLLFPFYFLRRGVENGSAAFTARFTYPLNVPVGKYNIVVGSWTGDSSDGDIVRTTNSLVMINVDGSITNLDGSPWKVRHTNKDAIATLTVPSGLQFRVGQTFRVPISGTYVDPGLPGIFGFSQNNFQFEWFEGREKLEIIGGGAVDYMYKVLGTGKLRFRLKQDDFVSDIFEIDLI